MTGKVTVINAQDKKVDSHHIHGTISLLLSVKNYMSNIMEHHDLSLYGATINLYQKCK
jgi:hypothetical protein